MMNKESSIKYPTSLLFVVITIALLSTMATLLGIFSSGGPGPWEHTSVHGQTVLLYGKGLYQWMPADVAIQGIAQDWITLLVGIPLLIGSLFGTLKSSIKSAYILTGTSFYFFVTYLFYLTMAFFSSLFLLHAILLAFSFFAVALSMSHILSSEKATHFVSEGWLKWAGGFLFFNSIMVAALWLSIVIPPLLDGTIYPRDLFHFTTLVVQGLDLGLLLPIGMVVGFLSMRGKSYLYPYLIAYLIFLSLMMLTLCSKIFFMARTGQSVIPVVFIMPLVFLIASFFSIQILRKTL